jgi:hypothetical protein
MSIHSLMRKVFDVWQSSGELKSLFKFNDNTLEQMEKPDIANQAYSSLPF